MAKGTGLPCGIHSRSRSLLTLDSTRRSNRKKNGITMEITPDHLVLLHWGWFHLNATIVYSWAVMLLLVVISRLAVGQVSRPVRSLWTQALEAVVSGLRDQIREISGGNS